MRITVNDGAVFDIVADDRRAHVVRVLADAPEKTLALDRLVERVARRADGGDLLERDRIAVRLHHVDLPKLSDAGVVEYDADDRTVRILTAATLGDWIAARDGLSAPES